MRWWQKQKIYMWRILGLKGKRTSVTCIGVVGLVVVALIVLIQFLGMLLSAHPEVGMVVRSQCANPIQNWNGKIYGIPVWTNWLGRGKQEHSILYRGDSGRGNTSAPVVGNLRSIVHDDKALMKGAPSVIIWGTHHRSGTYISQKVFSRICSFMGWCCLFHPTRSSAQAIHDSLEKEQVVHLFGHNQWIWSPQEVLGPRVDYKFIHFHRDPIKKIISGYSYHMGGNERWTKEFTQYQNLCKSSLYRRATSGADDGKPGAPATKEEVYDHCAAAHLCEPCCRREHQKSESSDPRRIEYQLRPQAEYEYLCKHLGSVPEGSNLQQLLMTLSVEEGMALEAALDYYENVRMINLSEATKDDKNTLHINVDYLSSNHRAAMTKIVHHMDLDISTAQKNSLLDALDFFNLKESWYYHYSMSNVFHNHVKDPGQAKTQIQGDMREVLLKQSDAKALYEPLVRRSRSRAQGLID